MKPKRTVSLNLGRTQHRDAEKHYAQIKKRLSAFRRCPFYNGKKYVQFSPDEHDELNPKFPNPNVPVEQFDFQYDRKKKNWKLQAYCKVCYKAYRDARIGKARATWIKKNGSQMTDAEIRSWYRKNVGPRMRCSVCKRMLDPNKFSISLSMEKGLHNVCIGCAAGAGTSVREQEWLSDGDWDSWKEKVARMRAKKRVRCVGWPRSQEIGACLRFDNGKRMHADHWVPLRAGGINDASNFQSLCNACNIRKNDQIDPRLSPDKIRMLVSSRYKKIVRSKDSVETIERKLKTSLVNYLQSLLRRGRYLDAIRKKKKEVNGQWNVNRAYHKGVEWLKRNS
jgi:5-methylcytosine-specific restriction endonuclease McrA